MTANNDRTKWPLARLGDLGEVNRGRSRHRPRYAEHLYGGPYPFIQTGDIKASGGRITSHTQTYSEAGLAQSRLWPTGTMAITIAANIAETAILTYPACFPDSVVGFIPDASKCDIRFVEYTFRHIRSRIQHEASGSVQDNINLATLDRLRFPLPDVATQRRIADILGSLDDKIELNRRMNETLEAMARRLFKSWFVDFAPVHAKAAVRRQHPDWPNARVTRTALPNLDPKIADLFPDAFEDSPLGPIPKGWEVAKLSELMTFQGGSQPPANEFVSTPDEGYVRLVQIRDFYTDSHITYVPDTSKLRRFTRDDVMIARYGSSGGAATKGKDSLGRICRGLCGAYNVALVRVDPHVPIREYLYYLLQSPTFQDAIRGMGARSVQSGFRKEDLDVIYAVKASEDVHSRV